MDLPDRDLYTSPFKSLVFTNDPPPDLEAKRVEEFLHDHLRELSKQDEEIARVSALLNRLTNKRRHLQQYITAHQGILSPIRTFPPEILAEIFMQMLDDAYDVFDTKRGPWALGHVCRRWKDASRSSPALWASLSIENLHLQPQLRHANLPAILEDVLALTSNQELSITYSLQSVIISDTKHSSKNHRLQTLWCNQRADSWDILQLLFDILVSHSTRWKTARLVIPFALGRRLQKARGSLASLVSIDLSPCIPAHLGSSCFDTKTIDVLSTAPKLQALTVTPIPTTIILPPIPCPQLRYLAHSFSALAMEHIQLLTEAPLLETYKADFSWDSNGFTAVTPFTHNSLRRLELCCRDSDLSFLESLACPSLGELALDLYYINRLEYILYDFDRRSGCRLRQLSVKFKDPGGVDTWLLNKFKPKRAERDLASLPSLAVLHITIETGQEETPEILKGVIRLIEARLDMGTSVGLRSVSVIIGKDNWTESEIEDKLNILRRFKDEGFDVSLKRNGS
ncbi:uncharacterized protein ARMOST_10296 [Armillaria ostoyae]|uniref:Uncharacterized protein n=1 Tax=Armillaria ostoyae TaxID=47428 RepID=A0A284RDX3_ARMOS|nr:uncharacterized protein ARMOST_10296 [Armillaria ostoyae]